MTQQRQRDRFEDQYLSRTEFQQFERSNARQMDELRSTLSELGRKLDRGTDWKAIFAGLSVFSTIILAIGGLIAYGLNGRMDVNAGAIARLVERTEKMQTNRWTRDQMDAYRDRVDDRFQSAEKETQEEVAQIDETLQREMRLLDDALQREMRMLLDEPLARLDAVADRVSVLDVMLQERGDWMAQHDREVSGLNANQTTRIDALEDRVDRVVEDLDGHFRFNRDDYDKYVLPVLDKLRERATNLETELARRSTTVERMEDEQNRRTAKVYGDAP